jgi:IS30 family transposase
MRTQKRLTPHERERILIVLGLGKRPADLARLLGRHRSVVTREIARITRGAPPRDVADAPSWRAIPSCGNSSAKS